MITRIHYNDGSVKEFKDLMPAFQAEDITDKCLILINMEEHCIENLDTLAIRKVEVLLYEED